MPTSDSQPRYVLARRSRPAADAEDASAWEYLTLDLGGAAAIRRFDELVDGIWEGRPHWLLLPDASERRLLIRSDGNTLRIGAAGSPPWPDALARLPEAPHAFPRPDAIRTLLMAAAGLDRSANEKSHPPPLEAIP